MHRTSLIGHVVELHAAVVSSRHPADSEVRNFLRPRHYLGSRDRRFITEVLYGMLRHHRILHERVRLASGLLGPGGLQPSSLVLYAAFAIGVASEKESAVEADIAPLCSVYLRGIDCGSLLAALAGADPLADPSLTPEARISLSAALPEFMVREWYRRYGGEETDALCRALNQPAPTTARVNTLQGSVDHCLEQLAKEGVSCRRTQLSPSGIVFEKRINIQSLSAFRRGLFEMQDEGSQLISLLVEPPPGGFVVDACAGGGGKTLHLAALMAGRGKLAAIEVSTRRLGNMRERIRRAGAGMVSTYSAEEDRDDIASWKGEADAVLVDAPCTGIGTFRRNPGARLNVTEQFLEAVSATQRMVLHRYADLVRPGGRLVYSTCTLLRKENEDVVEEFLGARPEFTLLPAKDILHRQGVAIGADSPFMELFPHRHGTDGFFAAVLTRLR